MLEKLLFGCIPVNKVEEFGIKMVIHRFLIVVHQIQDAEKLSQLHLLNIISYRRVSIVSIIRIRHYILRLILSPLMVKLQWVKIHFPKETLNTTPRAAYLCTAGSIKTQIES